VRDCVNGDTTVALTILTLFKSRFLPLVQLRLIKIPAEVSTPQYVYMYLISF
jgi:hypothetical protein